MTWVRLWRLFVCCFALLIIYSVALAQKIDGLSEQVKPILAKMSSLGAPLPQSVSAQLNQLAPSRSDAKIDVILGRYALLKIQINPESRVKVARGAAAALLEQNHISIFLIRVSNDSGITSPLRISGPNIKNTDSSDNIHAWLSVSLSTIHGGAGRAVLTGGRLEYAILALSTDQSGMREATLSFDVGQGTQDLGFRGETSILFRIRSAVGTQRLKPSAHQRRVPIVHLRVGPISPL